MSTSYVTPQIGYYQSDCCLACLYKIETQEELDDTLERIKDNDECGPLMVFATLEEACERLSGPSEGWYAEEVARHFKRLGYSPPSTPQPAHSHQAP